MTLDTLIKKIIDDKLQHSKIEYFKDSNSEIEKVMDIGDGFIYVHMKLSLPNLKTVGSKMVFHTHSLTRKPQMHMVGYNTHLDGLLPSTMIDVLHQYKTFMDDLKSELIEAYVAVYSSQESSTV